MKKRHERYLIGALSAALIAGGLVAASGAYAADDPVPASPAPEVLSKAVHRAQAVPENVDPQRLNTLAQELSEAGADARVALGVETINSVEVHATADGLTVFTSDTLSAGDKARILLIDGIPVRLDEGGEVVLQSR
ncbi:hypothetical protein J2Y69_000672 [Microbacterium resistens]|uniref:Uncharacterized protein n=1 Tax=Microbacterium resistens TaxID=156977 RepID=A0ABU1S8Z2_9MICO|nr:hypothetical protein [Microbacterium resistens]MDR6866087.1 hypothetical protein [Microbacterium resistens]